MHNPAPRIALIHATALAVDPIAAAFVRHWPQARRMNLLDDSLSVDRGQSASLTGAMVQRFVDLATYARGTGCEAILFTCSAFGPAVEKAAEAVRLPTLKPNEAMFRQALDQCAADGAKLGLVATFEASIGSMAAELQQLALQRGQRIDLRTVFVPEAMQDLAAGRAQEHHRKIAQAVRQLVDCAVLALKTALGHSDAAVSTPKGTTPDDLGKATRAQLVRYGDLIKQNGITVE